MIYNTSESQWSNLRHPIAEHELFEPNFNLYCLNKDQNDILEKFLISNQRSDPKHRTEVSAHQRHHPLKNNQQMPSTQPLPHALEARHTHNAAKTKSRSEAPNSLPANQPHLLNSQDLRKDPTHQN
ncbi:hypothetical protein TNIN_265631 [Trichonephila inaurata madagascariensis]|uniref:Uncharacterized protein n=1 Tax=Trichonephila inaurata madagascariensis TaxID=2747483 RepID=A0A8X7CPQ8_9ARAC|nr:hypothetical protein TNIN_265631 [Trichonephila inaurata madagascariensis]